ncbi:hypothetical protein [Schaedlerella arabinosiphila]|uniref:hypothetical protein n=1 Tax=Schaedlerella arabinosiphila TaxID=2044587 RepID=UPI0025582106|nr:hypothetical protein [Schaedlerella arabinosiphila]
MDNHINDLFVSICENLSGIFSEGITEKEFDLIKSAINDFFVINSSSVARLSTINDCLECILFDLMDGRGEDE